MSSPLISIIIPNYNRENLIAETLQSFLDQDYTNWECIIVDDGSTDNSIKVIQEFTNKDSRFKLIIRPEDKPKGANTCRNIGFEKAKGEFINWFDSDDVVLKEFLSELIQQFQENPEIDLAICECILTDEFLQPIETWKLNNNKENFYKDYIRWKQKIITGSVLFRKRFLNEKALFNPKIVRAQEAEFFYRMFFKLPIEKFQIINRPLFLYRQHSGSKTSKNETYNPNFKHSESIISINGLKNGIILNDNDIKEYCYNFTIRRLHAGLIHKDFNNVFYIVKRMGGILLLNDFKLFMKFIFSDFSFWTFKYYIRKAIK